MAKTTDSKIGQRMKDRDTLIGSSPRAARRRHGIHLQARTADTSGTEVRFEDGTRLSPRAVIWATGFGLDHSWIHLPVFDDDGQPVHQRGVTAAPGLYFLGMPWQHTRGSALLGWVKDDARHIAEHIDTSSKPAQVAA
jgi:putative flavoprotein involved in K+ transport